MNLATMSKDTSRLVAPLTAIVVTVATFAKIFVPFYLIGSTPIFVTSCFFGLLLIAFASRKLVKQTTYATEVLVLLIFLYSTVVASFLINSLHRVPITHLLGILIFHGVFLLFGFAAARSLKAIFAVLLAGAAIYILVIVQYVLRFGDLMQAGYLHDVFGVENPVVTVTFHQNIGSVLAIATLAATGLGWTRVRRVAFAALPLVFLFLFHIAARTAIVALAGSLLFFAGAELWGRSRRLVVAGFAAVMLTAAIGSTVFYERALQDKDVDAVAPDAITRTIREIQDPRPLFRIQIWTRAIHRIMTEPDQLPLGRGIGVFPIHEGFGAPDWLLRPAEGNKYYPHNVHLELLYETGLAGFLIFTVLTLLPLLFSLKYWDRFSNTERAAISLYVYYLASVEISGSFAYSYDFQFFFGLAAGVVALKRMELTKIGKIATPPNESPLPNFGKSPA